ncbi:MAG: glycosyltransferase family 4 protein [Candidatus Promineifilaceae bacterium]
MTAPARAKRSARPRPRASDQPGERRLRLLIVSAAAPAPTNGGGTRLYNLARQLAKRHAVSLVCLMRPEEASFLEALRPDVERLIGITAPDLEPLSPWRNRLHGWRQLLFSRTPRYAATYPVQELEEPLRMLLAETQFNAALAFELFSAPLLDYLGPLPAVLIADNVEHDIARQLLLQAGNPIHWLRDWLMWRRLRAYEVGWLRRCSAIAAVSPEDGKTIQAHAPDAHVFLVPNGVDSAVYAPPAGAKRNGRLLFFGTLNYLPNVEGLEWFGREIWARLRAARPDLGLDISGKGAHQRLRPLADAAGVQLLGFAPDIRPRLWQASVCVVPLLSGGGTRLKILEALAAGCPVVSTATGASGLDLATGDEILLADEPADFAAAVLRLLDEPDLWARLSEQGRLAAAERFDWGPIARQLERACRMAAGRPEPLRPGPQP